VAEPTPLVLLHPFPLDASFWAPVAPLLAADREVVTLEFPGLGAAPPAEAPSVDGYADLVAERIAVMRGGRAAVCGLSLGGYAALSLAARRPAGVAALVLADTRAVADTPEAGRAASRPSWTTSSRAWSPRATAPPTTPRARSPSARTRRRWPARSRPSPAAPTGAATWRG
jgi:pimeloyl-ACP methyl ester carboxylesterase